MNCTTRTVVAPQLQAHQATALPLRERIEAIRDSPRQQVRTKFPSKQAH